AGEAPAGPAQARPGRFAVAGGVLRARRGHQLLRGHAGVPGDPAAHPLPAGPDRRTDPGKAARGEADFFPPAHAALLAAMLERIDRVNAEIARLTEVIEALLAPHEEQLQQAESMPGWGRRAAQDALAETGADMSRFPSGAHLASWAGRTPLDNSSGKHTGRAKAKKG